MLARMADPDGAAPTRRSIVAVCLVMAVVGINTTAIGVASRGIAAELGVGPETLALIVGAYLLTAASFSLIGGRLGDVAGRSRTFVAGIVIFSVGALGAALAPDPPALIAARAVEGLGAALVLPASIELVAAHPPRSGARSGFRARGIVYASAFGIGPLLGGVLTDHLSWRAIFWFELVGLLLAGVLAAPLLHRTSTLPKPPTRDLRGAALSAILVAVALGSIYRISSWWSWPAAVALAVVVVLAVLLVRVESRTPHPILHRRVVTNRVVLGANVATVAASIGMLGLVYFFNLFAQSAAVFDSTALGVAVTLIPFTASIVLFSVVARRLSSRLGYRGPVLVGLGCAAAGFFWLSTTTGATSDTDLVLPLALCGIGAGIANAGLTTPAVLSLPRTRLDEAAGLFSLSRYVGSALAVAIGTSTFLAVAVQAPRPDTLAAEVSAEELALGGSTFKAAVATLDEDLQGPFVASTHEQSAAAFASTMRLAGFALVGLTALATVLLRRAGTMSDADLGGVGDDRALPS